MSKYLVKKEFPLMPTKHSFILFETDSVIDTDKLDSDINIASLTSHGFIEEIKQKWWRADFGGDYWYVDTYIDACDYRERCSRYDSRSYKRGNYFKSQETAELVAAAMKLLFKLLHTPRTGVLEEKDLYDDTFDSFNDARKAVLKDDGVEND